jgi:hypothetical protein
MMANSPVHRHQLAVTKAAATVHFANKTIAAVTKHPYIV